MFLNSWVNSGDSPPTLIPHSEIKFKRTPNSSSQHRDLCMDHESSIAFFCSCEGVHRGLFMQRRCCKGLVPYRTWDTRRENAERRFREEIWVVYLLWLRRGDGLVPRSRTLIKVSNDITTMSVLFWVSRQRASWRWSTSLRSLIV